MTLRPYQSAAIDAVDEWARTRPGEHPLLVLPTGSGKTMVMSGLVQTMREADPSARALILAHRRELLEQSVATAWRMFPAADVGIYAANLGRKDTRAPITVASIQSLQKDPYVLSAYARPIDRVLVDECHLVSSDADTGFRKTLQALHAVNPSVMIVGLTATPYRLGTGMLHAGDDALFSGIAYEVGIRELLEQGYLCPVRPRATTQRLSTAGVAVRGDYVPAQLAAAVDIDDTTRAIVAECCAAFHERQCWLVFGVSVEHSEHLAAAFRAAGISSAAVHGDLSSAERSSTLAAYKAGAIRCAVTCELLTTGFDHPQIDAIALARPTKSPGLFYQMVGRGFRIHPSKADCLVLDFAENTLRHGPVDTLSDRIVMRGTKEPGIAPAKECPVCQALVSASAALCPMCQHAFPPPVAAALNTTPSARPLLSIDVPAPLWEDVTDVEFSVNTPRVEGKHTTLRVDYSRGLSRVAAEWICFDHPTGSYPHSRALLWWRARFPDSDVPESVDQAYDWLTQAPPMHYTPVAVQTVPDGKFTRITDYSWPEARATWLKPAAGLPRACWTCRFMSAAGACALVDPALDDPTPPEWFQAVGCDDWQLMQDADAFAEGMRTGVVPVVLKRAA
jgi:DNA repair protein RadD